MQCLFMPVARDSNVSARRKHVDLSDSRGWNPRIARERAEEIAALASYVLLYTPLKRLTSLCTVVGAVTQY